MPLVKKQPGVTPWAILGPRPHEGKESPNDVIIKLQAEKPEK